jgi:16S rRNA processing protein RimM
VPSARVAVARLAGVFGIRGELKCKPASFGDAVLAPGRKYFTSADPAHGAALELATVRRHHERSVVTVAGIETPEAAQALVGTELFLERDEIDLGAGEYFDADLIGMRLLDGAGRECGTVVRIEHYPAQDCLVIAPGNALVPLVRAFAPKIDLTARTIAMTLPRGLLDASEAEEA